MHCWYWDAFFVSTCPACDGRSRGILMISSQRCLLPAYRCTPRLEARTAGLQHSTCRQSVTAHAQAADPCCGIALPSPCQQLLHCQLPWYHSSCCSLPRGAVVGEGSLRAFSSFRQPSRTCKTARVTDALWLAYAWCNVTELDDDSAALVAHAAGHSSLYCDATQHGCNQCSGARWHMM